MSDGGEVEGGAAGGGAPERPTQGGAAGTPTQGATLEAMDHVARVLGRKFAFGYYAKEDIKQEIRLMCWEALPRYDGVRDLKNFFYAHCWNRLLNLHRDKRMRNDPPCRRCHDGDPCGDDGRICKKYEKWWDLNSAKASLAQPAAWTDGVASRHADGGADDPLAAMAKAEVLRRLDEGLPLGLRADFLRMREGVPLPKSRRDAVVAACRAVLGGGDDEES